MINDRQKQIIEILNQYSGFLTGKEISQIVHVSDRTIRLDITKINEFYQCILIQSNKRFGYKIDTTLLCKQDIELTSMIPQTSNERCIYIIKELLFKCSEINVVELQDKVFVSGYSIDNDIKKIKKMLSQFPGLKLARNKNHITLQGNESDKRKLYSHLLTQETHGNFLNLNSLTKLFKKFNLIEIKDILENVCEKHQYQLDEVDLPLLMIHVGVAIDRIYQNNYIHKQKYNRKIEKSREYEIASHYFKAVSSFLKLDYVEDEVVLFAFLLMGKKQYEYKETNSNHTIDIEELFTCLVNDIHNVFGIDFSNDESFKHDFSIHLQGLIERMHQNIQANNLYLHEIKKNYPLIFEIAIHVSGLIKHKTGLEISENEIAFLALHLGGAYDRSTANKCYRAIIIMPNHQILPKMFIDKLKLRFDERMKIIKCVNFFETSMIQTLKPDLIITTVPLKHQLDIPTIMVTLFINYDDESRIFQTLNSLERKRHQNDFIGLTNNIMNPNLFFNKKTMKNQDEVINFLCDQLIEKGYASKAYKDDVIKRENISSTSFINGFAVPHSIEVHAKKSAIAIMILDKPIKWGQFEVKMILLLAIQDEEYHLLKIFFDWLSNVVCNPTKFNQLIEVNTYEEFIEKVIVEETI